jgi:glycosyltransferase involved in cell wall biosynthesis
MRVLHIVKTATGATWALRQIGSLIKQGIEVDVVLCEKGPMASKYRDAGASTHFIAADIGQHRSLKTWWQARLELRTLIAEVRPDVVHSHFVGTTIFVRLALGRSHPLPRVFQVPGPLHMEHRLTKLVDLITAGDRDYWIATSEATKSLYIRAGVDLRRLFLAYYGMDFDAITSRARWQGPLPAWRRGVVIGMVAYIYRPKYWLGQRQGLKGHEDLVDAVHALKEMGHSASVVFVGGAWNNADAYAKKVQGYAASKLGDAAVFLGNRDDVPALYTLFDVAVHPSHSENVGGAAESLLLEIPTVATQVGGIPDVVINKVTGWLVPPHDPMALAEAIADVLSQPAVARDRASAGAEHVRRLLALDASAAAVAEVYQQVVRHVSSTAPS